MPRPIPSFGPFRGQRRLVRQVRNTIAGCKALGVPFPHSEITGASGTGKNMLAAAIAEAFGAALHDYDASLPPALPSFGEFLRAGQPGDILFIDEVHRLGTRKQDALRAALSRADLQTSILLATDQPAFVQTQISNRLPGKFAIAPYSIGELRAIVFDCAAQSELLLTGQAATAIAAASHGIPRVAKNLLDNLRHFAAAKSCLATSIDVAVVRRCLRANGFDGKGLSVADRELLTAVDKFERASRATLATLVGTDEEAIRQAAVRLMKAGLLAPRSGAGYAVTDEGRAWLQNASTNGKVKING